MSEKLEQAKQAINQGDKRTAQRLLAEVLKANPQDDTAWVWLAATIEDILARRECFERALAINPVNQQALRGLAALREAIPSPDPPYLTEPERPPSASPLPKPEPKPALQKPVQGSQARRATVRPAAKSTRSGPPLGWLLIGGTAALLLLGLCGGALAVWAYSNNLFGPAATPIVAFTSTPSPVATTATAQELAIQPTNSPTFTPFAIEPSATPTQTSSPTSTSTPLPSPTPSPTPTSTPLPPPAAVDQFSSQEPTPETQPEILEVSSLPLSPSGQSEVSPSKGTGNNYSGKLLCEVPDTGYPDTPRLAVYPNGYFQLSNFQAGEVVDLYIYEIYYNSAELNGWATLQIDSLGVIRRQIINYSNDYVYVVIGSHSGEVINAVGQTFCDSIRPADRAVTTGPATLWDDDNNPHDLAPYTWLTVYSSEWENLDTLWWGVRTEDGINGYIEDSQVRIGEGPISVSPTQDSAGLSSHSSPDQAVRDYYGLIEQRRYDLTWKRLTDNFKDNFNCCTEDGQYDQESYKEWWNSVSQIQMSQPQVIWETATSAMVAVDLTYIRFSQSPYYDTGKQVYLIWDEMTQQWLFDDIK